MRVGCDRFLICFPLRYGILVVCVLDFILTLLFTLVVVVPEMIKYFSREHCEFDSNNLF